MTQQKRYRPFAALLVRNLIVPHYNVRVTCLQTYCGLHSPSEDKRIEKEVTENIVEYLCRD